MKPFFLDYTKWVTGIVIKVYYWTGCMELIVKNRYVFYRPNDIFLLRQFSIWFVAFSIPIWVATCLLTDFVPLVWFICGCILLFFLPLGATLATVEYHVWRMHR